MPSLKQLADGPPSGLDPAVCEREAIHIPGAIQPHGALLALLAESQIVTHASANLFDILGWAPKAVLGQKLESIIGDAATQILKSAMSGEETVIQRRTEPDGPLLRFRAFRTGRHIALDIEPIHPAPDMKPPMIAVQAVLATFAHATNRAELYQSAIAGLQAISGYDRVMVYQFGDRGHGEVVAESHAAHLEPYLGNHYPTTDVPPQARRQFLRQRVGSVADSGYQPVPLLVDARSDDGEPLDLAESTLRSVSPMHCAFMRNMGTSASLSIGLTSEANLLGLILCHHGAPRIAGHDLRAAADMIGQVVSLLLVTLGEAEIYAERSGRSDTLQAVLRRLASPVPLPAALMAGETELLGLLDATGAMLRLNGRIVHVGATPPPAMTARLLTTMESAQAGAMTVMDDVALAYPELDGCAVDGSGALLLPLSESGGDLILWFRPELSRIVTWAGDPDEHIQDPVTGRVLPRASFAAWKQTIRGRSKPWTGADLALAADFRRAFEDEVAKRAKVELANLRHHEELNDTLEIRISQRTKELDEQTSERLKAEAALQQIQKMDAIGQLTGGVAHDFNNVLAAVLGNLELAEASIVEPSVLRVLGRAKHAAERGAKLTHHLLSFARKQPLSRETCDANRLILVFNSLIKRTIGSSVLIKLDLAVDLWPVVADHVQFEMALLNIAVNARDAMPHGGALTIATRNSPAASADQPGDLPPGDYTVMSFQDTGIGMSEELMGKVFEPFFTTKKVGKGTGLGLSQVYGFCKQNGGTVTLTSQVGVGTCVNVFLPRNRAIAESPAVKNHVPGAPEPLMTPRSLRALVVDDDPGVLETTSEMLQSLGFDVVTANSGIDGVEILEGSTRVDFLVTDFSMPIMTGIELIRRARTAKPGLPCLLMTGYADVGNFAEAAAEKITVLRKPYKMKDLSSNIHTIQKIAALSGHQAVRH